MEFNNLPVEILTTYIAAFIDDETWGNLRLTCSLMRKLFPIDSTYGPIIYARGPRIGDRNCQYIEWRKECHTLNIGTKLNELPRPEKFFIQLTIDRAWKTLKQLLNILDYDNWNQLLTKVYHTNEDIFKRLFQRYIYLCLHTDLVEKWKKILYHNQNWEDDFMNNLDNPLRCSKLIDAGMDLNFKEKYNYSILMHVINNNNVEIAKFLIAAGANVNYTCPSDKNNAALNIAAIFKNNIEIVQLLLDAGANVNHANKRGQTALIKAVNKRNIEIVQFLLDAGAAVDLENINGNTALICACVNDDEKMVQLLLDAGANVNHADNDDGETALTIAIFHNHVSILKLLLTAGADANRKDYNGIKPLNKAIMCEHTEIVQLLCEAGATRNS